MLTLADSFNKGMEKIAEESAPPAVEEYPDLEPRLNGEQNAIADRRHRGEQGLGIERYFTAEDGEEHPAAAHRAIRQA